MIIEKWYVKRTSDSDPEELFLFYKNQLQANTTHNKALKKNDARILFGKDFPKIVASAWQ